jgi:magnesium transporter
VLANSLDAYGGVINNRLTQTMKVVGSLSLILMIPTIIASFYGMNVGLPGGSDPTGGDHLTFFFIIAFSFVISFAIWIFFRKNKWL